MRMSTKAQRLSGSDVDAQQINIGADQSPKNNGGICIAELRSRFQKDDDRYVAGSGSSPVSNTKSHHVVRPPLPVKPTVSASKSPLHVVDKQPELIREMQQKFGANNSSSSTVPSLPKKQLTNGNPHSSPGHGGVAAATTTAASSKSMPPIPTSNRPAWDGNHSPHKVPTCKSASLPTSSSPKNTRSSQSSGEAPTGLSTPNVTIRPNQSHLSSLISEIHQQQLQQQLQTKVCQQRLECEPLPRPPVPVPPQSSNTPPPLHRKTPPVELGPPPPLPLPKAMSAGPPSASPKQRWRRKVLPSLAELGAPPARPLRPPFVRLTNNTRLITTTKPESTPPLPQRNPIKNAALPLPPRLLKAVPAPPASVPVTEIQQLTSAVSSGELKGVSVASPIPEFTEEEELGDGGTDDFYDDADGVHRSSSLISEAVCYSSGSTSQQDELYHDASIRSNETDDVYEDIGVGGNESSRLSDVSSLTYSSKKESDRQRREEERRLKREQKEREKKARETEKMRKKFNLSGNEVPVYMGVVKETTKGRRREDLVVKQGDRVSILRIGENPIGKWLAQNDDGKVGYVDLTNIEVDADSIRYVMSQSKVNVTCANSADTLVDICDDEDSGEAIYEEFS